MGKTSRQRSLTSEQEFELAIMWSNPTILLVDIAKVFGVSVSGVRWYARILGLKTRVRGRKKGMTPERRKLRYYKPDAVFNEIDVCDDADYAVYAEAMTKRKNPPKQA